MLRTSEHCLCRVIYKLLGYHVTIPIWSPLLYTVTYIRSLLYMTNSGYMRVLYLKRYCESSQIFFLKLLLIEKSGKRENRMSKAP